MRCTIIIALITLIVPVTAVADDWDDFVLWTLEQYDGDDDGDDANLNAMLEQLEALHLNPINLNDCHATDLERITFLSPQQVDDIIYYLARVRTMRTLAELIYIPSLDLDTRRFLPLFVYVGQPLPERHRPSDGRHELQTRLDLPLYHRLGYDPSTNHHYRGSRIAHNLKYSYTLPHRLTLSLVCDKDQGEPLGRPFATAYDFVGGHLALSNVGCLRTIIVGDYQVGFGEGLLINQQYMLGKSMARTVGIRAKTSTAETTFMRGVAATVDLAPHLALTPFASYTLLDANTDDEGRATSLSSLTTHRNDTELSRRHNNALTLCGLHAEWRDSLLTIGATAYTEHFHLAFVRGDAPHRRYYPEGNDFWGASVDYRLRLSHFTLSGELATDGNGTAMLTRLTYRHNARLQAQAAYRLYDQRYYSLHSRSLSEWGVHDERGLYLAIDVQPLRQLTLNASLDLFTSPHQRYLVAAHSKGQHLRLRLDYKPSSRHSLFATATLKHREQYNLMHLSQRYQLGYTTTLRHLTLRQQASLSHYSDAAGRRSLGYALQSRATWRATNHLRLATSLAWFSTHDYYSRLYLAEPTVTTAPTYAMLYGRGIRFTLTSRLTLAQRLQLTLRYTFARRFDVNTLSTQLQTIPTPWLNDLSLHLRLRW